MNGETKTLMSFGRFVRSAGTALLALALLGVASQATAATTYYVATNGNDSAEGTSWSTALRTISNGVAKAINGDEVVLSNGVHTVTEFVVINKGITVRGGTGNREDVIVDGNYPATSNRCFVLSHANAVLADLTVTNGYGAKDAVFQTSWSFGGGVYLNASGKVRNCLITGNRAANRAGGAYLASGGMVTNCLITANTCPSDGGGFVGYGSAKVVDCVVSNNLGGGGGGGYLYAGLVSGCDIVDNTATLRAGGFAMGVGVIITNCLIQNNRVIVGKYHGGGGVYATGGTITDCRIIGNDGGTNSPGGGVTMRTGAAQVLGSTIVSNVSARGGGIALEAGCVGLVRNCLIAGNVTTNVGGWGNGYSGGINLYEAPGTIENCTVVENVGATLTGGIGIHDGGTVMNCIVYSNRLGAADNNWDNSGTMTMVYTNCFTTPLTGLPGTGNIDGDPLFVGATNGDYRLLYASVCRNAGTNQSWMASASDLDGNPRLDPYAFLVDIGAYENMDPPPPPGTVIKLR